jgi:hypothetical protein
VLLRNSLQIGLAKSESNLRIFYVLQSLAEGVNLGANMGNYTQRVVVKLIYQICFDCLYRWARKKIYAIRIEDVLNIRAVGCCIIEIIKISKNLISKAVIKQFIVLLLKLILQKQ